MDYNTTAVVVAFLMLFLGCGLIVALLVAHRRNRTPQRGKHHRN